MTPKQKLLAEFPNGVLLPFYFGNRHRLHADKMLVYFRDGTVNGSTCKPDPGSFHLERIADTFDKAVSDIHKAIRDGMASTSISQQS